MLKLEDLLAPADLFAQQLKMAKIGGWQREQPFVCGRRFRADFLWLKERCIVEIDGGTWARKGAKKCRFCGHVPQGRHSTGAGREGDCEKQVLATLAGYRYLVVTTSQVKSGEALGWVREILRHNS